ncbi:Predicted membrane protein [Oligella ureolytica]|uniref:Phage holin family protein n=1 Tax=Oligella ureolytica TaxID=90244 RepID=A0A378XCR7_9BURK|nr:phage holin family protein [Oligella ureolytica]QPT40740.1 phage holin family protein [Oligella ureolytica]SUA52598.1 Predicted membrane protein [Oligella ureolytica]
MSLGQNSKELLGTVAAMLSNRVELISLELAEERERLVSVVMYAIATAILAAFFLLGLSFLILMLVWDSPYRFAVIGGMTVFYAIVAMFCVARVKSLFAEAIPFASSIQVFKDDAAKIKGELLTAPPFTEDSPAARSTSASSSNDNRSKEF